MDEGAVFATALGGRITPMAATKAFGKLAKTALISTTGLHDTRHTAASHLIVGCRTDARTAASVLGHTNPSVTLSIYAHLFADAQRAALSGLGKRLERISAAAANGGSAPDVFKATATEWQPSRRRQKKSPVKIGRSVGGGKETRTPDPYAASVMLYQLSYAPIRTAVAIATRPYSGRRM